MQREILIKSRHPPVRQLRFAFFADTKAIPRASFRLKFQQSTYFGSRFIDNRRRFTFLVVPYLSRRQNDRVQAFQQDIRQFINVNLFNDFQNILTVLSGSQFFANTDISGIGCQILCHIDAIELDDGRVSWESFNLTCDSSLSEVVWKENPFGKRRNWSVNHSDNSSPRLSGSTYGKTIVNCNEAGIFCVAFVDPR